MDGNKVDDYTVQFDESFNPTISCPQCLYNIHFYFTKEDSSDIEKYRRFINNAVSAFRGSRLYKNYKGFLIGMGMDQCQVLPGITVDMTEKGDNLVEMHHNFLTIHDVAVLICEHTLNTYGFISSFDLVSELKEVHRASQVPIVMLSTTVHDVFHDNEEFMLPASMTFGFWQELLNKYQYGITPEIDAKIRTYLSKTIEFQQRPYDFTNNLLETREEGIKDWSRNNGIKGDNLRIGTYSINTESNF